MDDRNAAAVITGKFKEGDDEDPIRIGPIVLDRIIERIEKQSF